MESEIEKIPEEKLKAAGADDEAIHLFSTTIMLIGPSTIINRYFSNHSVRPGWIIILQKIRHRTYDNQGELTHTKKYIMCTSGINSTSILTI